ncbi:MAG TPA: hypothetical protein PKK12_05480 [Candidatus Aminicenantes bacterium]|nr:hypothetical protein [Candidatus Aminicenantes bacterium]
MKRLIVLFCLLGVGSRLPAFFLPTYHGARSLALGFSGLAYSLDTDAQGLNPAMLAQLSLSMTGYQYQTNSFSVSNFNEKWNELQGLGTQGFLALPAADRAELWTRLQASAGGRPGLWGGQRKRISGTSGSAAFSVSWIDEAVFVPTDSPLWAKDSGTVTAEDLTQLSVNWIGWSYVQYAASYSFALSRGVSLGVTGRYLKGQGGTGQEFMLGGSTLAGQTVRDRLKPAWTSADGDFHKIFMDASLSLALGSSFLAGVMVENVTRAKVSIADREIAPPRRATVGIAFRPTTEWGFFLDVDVAKTALFYATEKSQPISLGMERSFFNQALWLRIGLGNDLGEEYFLGRKSNMLYGLGIGIQLDKLVIDGALSLDRDGRVRSMAVSGFLRFGKTN